MTKKMYAALVAAVAMLVAGVAAPGAIGQTAPAPAAAPAPRADGDRPAVRRTIVFDSQDSRIGVSLRDSDATAAAGAMVDEVEPDSPASKAGVKAGDLFVEFDGERVRSARQLTRLVRETPPGRAVKVTVLRDGSRQTLSITPASGDEWAYDRLDEAIARMNRRLREVPRTLAFDFDRMLPPEPPEPPRPPRAPRAPREPGFERWFDGARLGASVQPLGDQLATYFGVKDGVLVSDVAADSAAAKAGLKAGDVITAIDGHAVVDPDDLVRGLREAEGKTVPLAIVRDRKPMTVKATIERASRPRVARPA